MDQLHNYLKIKCPQHKVRNVSYIELNEHTHEVCFKCQSCLYNKPEGRQYYLFSDFDDEIIIDNWPFVGGSLVSQYQQACIEIENATQQDLTEVELKFKKWKEDLIARVTSLEKFYRKNYTTFSHKEFYATYDQLSKKNEIKIALQNKEDPQKAVQVVMQKVLANADQVAKTLDDSLVDYTKFKSVCDLQRLEYVFDNILKKLNDAEQGIGNMKTLQYFTKDLDNEKRSSILQFYSSFKKEMGNLLQAPPIDLKSKIKQLALKVENDLDNILIKNNIFENKSTSSTFNFYRQKDAEQKENTDKNNNVPPTINEIINEMEKQSQHYSMHMDNEDISYPNNHDQNGMNSNGSDLNSNLKSEIMSGIMNQDNFRNQTIKEIAENVVRQLHIKQQTKNYYIKKNNKLLHQRVKDYLLINQNSFKHKIRQEDQFIIFSGSSGNSQTIIPIPLDLEDFGQSVFFKAIKIKDTISVGIVEVDQATNYITEQQQKQELLPSYMVSSNGTIRKQNQVLLPHQVPKESKISFLNNHKIKITINQSEIMFINKTTKQKKVAIPYSFEEHMNYFLAFYLPNEVDEIAFCL